MDPARALDRLRTSTVFTTHTPVPAGNEVFEPQLVERNVGAIVERCGLSWPEFAELGKVDPDDTVFGMTPFSLRTSGYANGVAQLHGAVSREMWHAVWPERPLDEVPITSITNGVHGARGSPTSWRRCSATRPRTSSGRATLSDAVHLVGASRRRRQRMLEFIARTRGADASSIPTCSRSASRAASRRTSARGCSSASPSGLRELLGDHDRPLQILVAGKAHPADEGGKDVIQHVVEFARDSAAAGRVVFLEDYEMMLARRLVQGVDVWLNTPRRPMEASGTSGMKAALNGVLNCSILDGWWAEAYTPRGRLRDRPRGCRRHRGRAGSRRCRVAVCRTRAAGDPDVLRAGRSTSCRRGGSR